MPSLSTSDGLAPPPTSPGGMLRVRGAREHNLQDVHVDLPLAQFVVVTGVSGSGKTSLAVDTLAALGQRRMLDSLGSSWRTAVDRLDVPDVDIVSHMPPPVLVRWEGRRRGTDSRATVATLLDLPRGLAELFAAVGTVTCPTCDRPVDAESADSVVDQLTAATSGRKIMLAFRLSDEHRRRGPAALVAQGSLRGVSAGRLLDFSALSRFPSRGDVDVVVDRLMVGSGDRERWTESVELAFREGGGVCVVYLEGTEGEAAEPGLVDSAGRAWTRREFSQQHCCTGCGEIFDAPFAERLDLSSSHAACPSCRSRGRTEPAEVCTTCGGRGYSRGVLAVRIAGANIPDVLSRTPSATVEWIREISDRELASCEARLPESLRSLEARIECLKDIGLGHLTLDRRAETLSSGEIRRILLVQAATTDLAETLLIVEEPAGGVHPSDVPALLRVLRRPLSARQSLLVVEHDAEVVAAADHVLELGPGPGDRGGRVVNAGAPADLQADPETATGQAWAALRDPATCARPREFSEWLTLEEVTGRNFRGVDVRIPVGGLTLLTGVSGAGKTSLLMGALAAALAAPQESRAADLSWRSFDAPADLGCVVVDTSPLTSSARSTVVTWVKAFDDIRQVFAETADARRRGWSAGHFSLFSQQGLRCPACGGRGVRTLELVVLPDASMTCPECAGTRYRSEALDARYRGLTIVDVLRMTVGEAVTVFRNRPQLYQRFQALSQLGLDYLVLGQPTADLSGGEAQRVRLASRLWAKFGQRSVFLCDEPSVGMHPLDVPRLANCCRQLVELGQTVVLADNQRALLEAADWVIEVGPGPGDAGGRIVASGHPAPLMVASDSLAGRILRGERFV